MGWVSFLYGTFKRWPGFTPMGNQASLRNSEPFYGTALLPRGAAEFHTESAAEARPQPGETSSVNKMQRERVGRKGMEKRFCITLSLHCLDWKALSLCPSRQLLDHLEVVPTPFLCRAEAGAVCNGRCQGAQQPTGRKVLFSKKKKKKKPKSPPLELWSEETWILFQALCSFWVALDMSHCWLFSSPWKSRVKGSRGVSFPARCARRSAAHQELLAQPLMDEMGFLALLQLPATAGTSIFDTGTRYQHQDLCTALGWRSWEDGIICQDAAGKLPHRQAISSGCVWEQLCAPKAGAWYGTMAQGLRISVPHLNFPVPAATGCNAVLSGLLTLTKLQVIWLQQKPKANWSW